MVRVQSSNKVDHGSKFQEGEFEVSKYQSGHKYELRQNIKPKIAPLTAAVSGVLAAGSLQAATITVDTLSDSLGDANACSLRAALYASTTNGTFDSCQAGEVGEDTIVFDSALSGTIALQAGTGLNYYDGSTLAVGQSVIIDGDGDITIQGTGNAPVFYSKYDSTQDYNAESLALYGLTITGGGGARGGGIRSRSPDLALTSTTITGNTVTESGGGVSHEPYTDSANLTMLASQVTANTVSGAGGTGGGVAFIATPSYPGAQLQISGSTFSGNEVTAGNGGGLFVGTDDYTSIEMKYSIIEANTAGGTGAGVSFDIGYAIVGLNDNDFIDNVATGAGGGLYLREDEPTYQQAEITLNENTFTNNSGSSGGGAAISVLYGNSGTNAAPVKSVGLRLNLFENNNATTGGGGLFLQVSDTVPATMEANSFAGNATSLLGGGAMLADVDASEITFQGDFLLNNTANDGDGGGIHAALTNAAFYASNIFVGNSQAASGGGGGLQVLADNSSFGVEYSDFVSNTSSGCGGGIRLTGTPNEVGVGHSVLRGNYANCGGAMSLFAPSATNVLVEVKYNEMSYNQTTGGSGTSGGAAIFSEFGSGSTLAVKNSTISINASDSVGGGLALRGAMNAEIKYATIANNYAFDQGGGVYNALTSCSINNTILAGNENQTGVDQDLSGPEDCNVSNSLLGGAKYSNYSDGGGNILDTDPLLVLLEDNGGNAGQTHALQPGSPAIDAGSAGSFAPSGDQRGPAYPRVQGSALDMGAFEVGPAIDEIFGDRFEQP